MSNVEAVPIGDLYPDAVFGRLVLVRRVENGKGRKARWLCICACGSEYVAEAYSLRRGITRHCGCDSSARSRAATTHGGSRTRLYRIWKNMHRRCDLETHPDFPNYGGRGIEVCQEWSDFARFREDLGEPGPRATLDRIDNDGDYEPGNCRWATPKQQARNTRRNRLVTYRGRRMSLAEASELAGVPYKKVWERISRQGWALGRALT